MQTTEAKAYATKRYKELADLYPNVQNRVNLIIKELRVKHKFDTLVFSVKHSGYVRVKSVEFPSATNGNVMAYNFF